MVETLRLASVVLAWQRPKTYVTALRFELALYRLFKRNISLRVSFVCVNVFFCCNYQGKYSMHCLGRTLPCAEESMAEVT